MMNDLSLSVRALQDFCTFLSYGRYGRWSSANAGASGYISHFIVWNEVCHQADCSSSDMILKKAPVIYQTAQKLS